VVDATDVDGTRGVIEDSDRSRARSTRMPIAPGWIGPMMPPLASVCSMALAILGDYNDGIPTLRALETARSRLPAELEAIWVPTDSEIASTPSMFDGVWLAPGGPYRDDCAVYRTIRQCTLMSIPFLGTCSGFQYACVALLRLLARLDSAAHAETEPNAATQAITPLPCPLHHVFRQVLPTPGSRLAGICGAEPFEGYHNCGYGLADGYREALEDSGVRISAAGTDAGVEALELPWHPFFMATLFQPQMGREAPAPHPLIQAFASAVRAKMATRPLPTSAARTIDTKAVLTERRAAL
jgi:CTP synthase (UTP-ammonia lyase)